MASRGTDFLKIFPSKQQAVNSSRLVEGLRMGKGLLGRGGWGLELEDSPTKTTLAGSLGPY